MKRGPLMLDNFLPTRRMFVAGLAASSVPGFAAGPRTLDDLIALNTRARGGRRRLDRLCMMDAVIRISEPSYTAIGTYAADRIGRVRVDVFMGGKRAFSEGVDADGAWAWPGDQPEPAPAGEKGRQALLHGVAFNVTPLYALPRDGHRLELITADPPCLQLTFVDGFETRLFLDTASSQIVRRQDRRAYHPDLDSTEKRIEGRFSDFRMTDGVVSAWHGEDWNLDSGQRIGWTETLRLVWDQDVSARIPRTAVARMPAEAS
jgi:hypothetical protein